MEKTGLDSLPNVQAYSAPSPFDYKRNCLLYFPESSKGEPHGSDSESKRIAKEILRLVHATGGHTLVLFTSYSLMGAVYSLVKDQMPVPLMEVWRNSQDTIRRFKRGQNSVLFAAGSCWEGIDFPGDIVSSLIIPRLPFPVPDPIREAQRPNYMTLQDYIQAVIVPEMQVKLRQGFGRAIRTETDTCVVSILDHRAAPGGKYHREVTEALPSVPVTRQIEDVERFIRARKGPDYFCAKEGGSVPENREVRTVWLYSRSGSQSLSVLTAQMRELLEEAERKGYIVAGTSQDQHNGNGAHRAGLKLMMGAVRSGHAHIVMVWDLSRLSRDNSTLIRILNFLQDHGAVLVTAGTDLRYELSIRGVELPLRKRAAQKGRDVPW